jgi:hypothetical protein
VIGTAYVAKEKRSNPFLAIHPQASPAEMKNLMQDDIVDLFCTRRRPRGDGEEKHAKPQYQSISALGPQPGAIRLPHAKCGGVPDAPLSIYLVTRALLLAVIGWTFISVGRVQEGKNPAERATIARVAAANGGYVGTAAVGVSQGRATRSRA